MAAVAVAPATTGSIPDGAQALVRLTQGLDSTRHPTGHRFTAKLESDLRSGAVVIAPRGSEVYGELVSAQQSRRMVGQSGLGLKLTGVLVGGQVQPVASSTVQFDSGRTGRDTLRSAGLGAAIGAIADGSNGAGKGAAIGGVGSALTRGQTVSLDSGTILEFVIGPPGSAVAGRLSEQTEQPRERLLDRRRRRF